MHYFCKKNKKKTIFAKIFFNAKSIYYNKIQWIIVGGQVSNLTNAKR